MKIRTYRELSKLESFLERFEYLALRGQVGEATFGFDRYLNQLLYTSREWREARREVIIRDSGCDLGVDGYEIHGQLFVHHMNPITIDQVKQGDEVMFDPDQLITTTHRTHNAIHYGDERLLPRAPVERSPGDTSLWRRS